MALKQLAYFVHVVEFASFTGASRFLSMAQPALSRQVRALEVELRQPLFERNGRGVTLTEAGKRLLAHRRGLLQQVERARQDLETHRGAPAGRLVIGLPPSVGRSLSGTSCGGNGADAASPSPDRPRTHQPLASILAPTLARYALVNPSYRFLRSLVSVGLHFTAGAQRPILCNPTRTGAGADF